MSEPSESRPPALVVRDLRVAFRQGARRLDVVHGVDLTVPSGGVTALVGESGSGKSTIAKAIVGMVDASGGEIGVEGTARDAWSAGRWRRSVQLISQDPYASLNPRRTIGQSLAEALDPRRPSVRRHRDRIEEWLERVDLDPRSASRYPHEFSGGQRQRVAIARALAVEPRIIIADEITSALDVSVQARILDLLNHLRRDMGLTMLFITHNLAVVEQFCDDVVVLLRGDVVESGSVESVFAAPTHPYTRTLLDSVPGRRAAAR